MNIKIILAGTCAMVYWISGNVDIVAEDTKIAGIVAGIQAIDPN